MRPRERERGADDGPLRDLRGAEATLTLTLTLTLTQNPNQETRVRTEWFERASSEVPTCSEGNPSHQRLQRGPSRRNFPPEWSSPKVFANHLNFEQEQEQAPMLNPTLAPERARYGKYSPLSQS